MLKIPDAIAGVIFTLFVALVATSTLAEEKKDEKEKPKLQEVRVKDITLNVPKTWEKQKPGSPLRLAQFKIPAAKGDKVVTEMYVYSFPGGGGGLQGNLPRWVREFQSEGQKVKIFRGKSRVGEYAIVDLQGTHVGPSFRKRSEPLKEARMLAVVIAVEGKDNYFLKMTGPAKSVTAAAKSFRASFGADAKKEKEDKKSQ